MDSNVFFNCDCLEGLALLPAGCIDLTVTSPPYDNLRDYCGMIGQWGFEKFKAIASELFRVTASGGTVVWIVSDATQNGSETGTSFRQALFFKGCGFNLHDTMIWKKPSFTATGSLKVRYGSVFEYMFVFSKGKPKAFNPIIDRPNKTAGTKRHGTLRLPDGSTRPVSAAGKIHRELGQRFNVWEHNAVCSSAERMGHPAQFPVSLVKDHIVSWSNPGDLVLDPFLGSGTTAVAAVETGRRYIGYEINPEYFKICQQRISRALSNGRQE